MDGKVSFILTIVVYYVTPVLSDPCGSQEGRIDAYQACFTKQGIQANDVFDSYRNQTTTLDSLEVPLDSLLTDFGDTLCRQSEATAAFKEAVRCTYMTDFDCASPRARATLVEPDLMAGSLDPMCAHRQETDFKCALTRHQALVDCSTENVREGVKPGQTMEEIKCLFYREMTECTKREYQQCGCATAKVYSEIVLDILTPENCTTEDLHATRVVCNGEGQGSLATGNNRKRGGQEEVFGASIFGGGGGGAGHLLPMISLVFCVAAFSLFFKE